MELVLKAGLTVDQLLIVNGELCKKKKSKLTTYLLLLFFGGFGAHRFYLDQEEDGFTCIIVWITSLFMHGIPLAIWLIVELCMISKEVDEVNESIMTDNILEFTTN